MSVFGTFCRLLLLEAEALGQEQELKPVGGSKFDVFNHFVINQALRSHWYKGLDHEELTDQQLATIRAMNGIAPKG